MSIFLVLILKRKQGWSFATRGAKWGSLVVTGFSNGNWSTITMPQYQYIQLDLNFIIHFASFVHF